MFQNYQYQSLIETYISETKGIAHILNKRSPPITRLLTPKRKDIRRRLEDYIFLIPKSIIDEKLIFGKSYEKMTEKCAICLDVDSNFMTSCGHFFHNDCLANWKKKDCAMCRSPINRFRRTWYIRNKSSFSVTGGNCQTPVNVFIQPMVIRDGQNFTENTVFIDIYH